MNISPVKEILSPFSIDLYVVMRPSLVGAPNPIMSQFGPSVVVSENLTPHCYVFPGT